MPGRQDFSDLHTSQCTWYVDNKYMCICGKLLRGQTLVNFEGTFEGANFSEF